MGAFARQTKTRLREGKKLAKVTQPAGPTDDECSFLSWVFFFSWFVAAFSITEGSQSPIRGTKVTQNLPIFTIPNGGITSDLGTIEMAKISTQTSFLDRRQSLNSSAQHRGSPCPASCSFISRKF